MKKILIYYPFPLRDTKSGSAVRPLQLIKAFREYANQNNIEMIEVYGENKERKRKIKSLIKEVKPEEILFCYMENSTLPFWLTDEDHLPRTPFLERTLFRYLKKNNIPLGVFYRDVYWMFDEEYPLKGYKRTIMRKIYNAEYSLYKKYATHFFLPSMEMNRYVKFPEEKTSNLPPGGDNLLEYHEDKQSNELNIIYVGGISERYGLNNMLKATKKAYEYNRSVKLHLVCRKEEYEQQKKIFLNINEPSWLKIYHAHGDELKEIYKMADVGIIPIRKNIYNDFAVPVKLFEYLSYGLPIISTDCNAQAHIIKKYEIGKVVEDDVKSLATGICYFQKQKNVQYHALKVKESLESHHLWIHRVKEIAQSLERQQSL